MKSDLIKVAVGMIGFQTVVLLGAALDFARVLARSRRDLAGLR